ncbi:hypothetical protein [Mycobacteroides salmoniphilum]|uniref:hypothetical protein n=1 Tax=Mycobacteroides salmoniphilum TaxID=404941 RepID=UPI0012FFA1C7|nr:hypothetical protein [Mycobacteroides salmoniphilum]
MANTGADDPIDRVIEMLRQLLDEPPPTKYEPDWAALSGGEGNPIGQAISGFLKALRTVNDTDYQVAHLDWQERQRRANGWVDYLEPHVVLGTKPLRVLIRSGGRIEFVEDIVRSPKWDEMAAELPELLAWGAGRLAESARKHRVFGEGLAGIGTIIKRSKERMTEIAGQVDHAIEKDAEGRDKAISAGRLQVTTISQTTVGRVSTQTRRVLDLDESTAAISVSEWLEMHGLDTDQPTL